MKIAAAAWLLLLLTGIGCASSKADPEYAKRIAEFGKPDLIADHSGGTSRFYSPELARARPPARYEVYYYLNRDEQVAFQQGVQPVKQPIPPTMKDYLANVAQQSLH